MRSPDRRNILCFLLHIAVQKPRRQSVNCKRSQGRCQENRKYRNGKHRIAARKPHRQRNTANGRLYRGFRRICRHAEKAFFSAQRCFQHAHPNAHHSNHQSARNQQNCRRTCFPSGSRVHCRTNQHEQQRFCRHPKLCIFRRKARGSSGHFSAQNSCINHNGNQAGKSDCPRKICFCRNQQKRNTQQNEHLHAVTHVARGKKGGQRKAAQRPCCNTQQNGSRNPQKLLYGKVLPGGHIRKCRK